MSIRDLWEKGKISVRRTPEEHKHQLFVVVLLILVGTASFGFGRLSVLEHATVPVNVEFAGERGLAATGASGESLSTSAALEMAEKGEVVGSKNGSKYHFPWCSGAKQIAEKNLVTFASIEAARAAGYTPAANCKGLK